MARIMFAVITAMSIGLLCAAVHADGVDDFRLALTRTADIPNCKTGTADVRLDCLETALQQQATEILHLRMALREVTEPKVRPLGQRP